MGKEGGIKRIIFEKSIKLQNFYLHFRKLSCYLQIPVKFFFCIYGNTVQCFVWTLETLILNSLLSLVHSAQSPPFPHLISTIFIMSTIPFTSSLPTLRCYLLTAYQASHGSCSCPPPPFSTTTTRITKLK